MEAGNRRVIDQLGVYKVVDPKASRSLTGAKQVVVLAFNDVTVQLRRDDGEVCAIGMLTAGIALEFLEAGDGQVAIDGNFSETSANFQHKISKRRMDAAKMAEDFFLDRDNHFWW